MLVFTRRPLGFGFAPGAFTFILVFIAFSPSSSDVRLAESNALELCRFLQLNQIKPSIAPAFTFVLVFMAVLLSVVMSCLAEFRSPY
jgi:hypothetical protein